MKLISRGSTQGLYRDGMGPRPTLTAGPISPVSLIFNEEENRPGLVFPRRAYRSFDIVYNKYNNNKKKKKSTE